MKVKWICLNFDVDYALNSNVQWLDIFKIYSNHNVDFIDSIFKHHLKTFLTF